MTDPKLYSFLEPQPPDITLGLDPFAVTKDAKDFRFYYNGVAYTAGDIADALEYMIARSGRRPGTVAAEENETP